VWKHALLFLYSCGILYIYIDISLIYWGNLVRKALKRIARNKVSINFVIIGAVASLQAVNAIILGRLLSKGEFGFYSFLFTSIVPLVSTVVIFGQNVSVVRYFSNKDLSKYNWKTYYRNVTCLFAFLIIILTSGISFFYKLDRQHYIFLSLAIFSAASLAFSSSFLRAKKRYIASILVERASPPIFIVMILIGLSLGRTGFYNFTVMKTISYAAAFLAVMFLFLFREKSGSEVVKRNIYADGVLLWAIGLTLIAINRVDGFFIARFLNYELLALYSAVFVLVQVYDFAAQAIWSVYSQRFSDDYNARAGKFSLILIIISLAITSFYAIFGKWLLTALFKGKYDAGSHLLLPFCVIGILKVVYMYPACYLVGKSSTTSLKTFLNFNIAGVLLKIVMITILIKHYGLAGVVLSGIIVWGFRNIVGYYIVYKDKRKKKANRMPNTER